MANAEEGVFGFGLRPKQQRKSPLMGRDLLTLKEFSAQDICIVLALAAEMKARPALFHRSLVGATLAMIFAKPSTRTRVSFEAGMNQLGGHAIFLSERDLQLGRGETIADTARVLSRYVDAIMIRTFAQSDVEQMAEAATVPVINGLTDDWHPCQVLADLLTIAEIRAPETLGKRSRSVSEVGEAFKGAKIAYVGDGNNMANTLVVGAAITGMRVAVASPIGYEVPAEIITNAQKTWNAEVVATNDPLEAVKDADFIYTDVWASMGQEEEHAIRVKAFDGYQVNAALLSATGKKETKVLHCLPAHRGEEISAEVLESEASVVWDEAENRLHAQKALLLALILEHSVDGIGI